MWPRPGRFRRSQAKGTRPSVRLEPGSVPGGSGGGGRMSAEAADREAATSSRPCTPPQTSWFEFLLEESLLEKHLRKPCPGKRGACTPRARGPGHGRRPPGSQDPHLLGHEAAGPGGANPWGAVARHPRQAFSIPEPGRCRGGLENAKPRPSCLSRPWLFYCLRF